MKKIFVSILLLSATLFAVAQEKMSFVVGGPETTYNQIRVVNETSLPDLSVRVVVLDQDDKIITVYGEYVLNGIGDTDSHTSFIAMGAKIGIQLPKDFATPLAFNVEYKDYPFFDAIIVHLRDKGSEFGEW